jgi:hypothetical protein
MIKAVCLPQSRRQRGLTLVGLLLWAILIAIVGLIGAKVVPTVTEYMSCLKAVKQAATETTPDAARSAFDRYAEVAYINAITGKDINIDQGPGDSLIVSFAYDKEIPLAGPVYLIIKYSGSSNGAKKQ